MKDLPALTEEAERCTADNAPLTWPGCVIYSEANLCVERKL